MDKLSAEVDPELFIRETLAMSVDKNAKLGYFGKIILALNVILLLIVLVAGYVQMVGIEDKLKNNVSNELDSAKMVMSMNIKNSINDLFFLNDVIAQEMGSEVKDKKKFVQATLLNFMQDDDAYDQARMINVEGRELIRINRTDRDMPYVVPEAKLQDKSKRYYFKESIELEDNLAYISKLDLNMDNDEVERPYKLVLRMATPIYWKQKLEGVLVLNFLGSALLSDTVNILKQGDESNDKYFLLNSKGEPLAYIKWDDEAISVSRLGFDAAKEFEETFKRPSTALLGLKDGVFQNKDIVFAKTTIRADTTVVKTKKRDKFGFVKMDISADIEGKDSDLILLSVSPGVSFWHSLDIMFERDLISLIWIELLLIVIALLYSQSLFKQKLLENTIKAAAAYDPLTSVYNRRFGILFLEYELKKIKRTKGTVTAFMVDVNNLKKVNDACGHNAGDELLKVVAERMKREVREYDIVSRIGGDEFIIAFSGVGLKSGEEVLERIRTGLVHDYAQMFNDIGVDFAYGGAEYDPQQHETLEDLLHIADARMYEDKKRRKQGRDFS